MSVCGFFGNHRELRLKEGNIGGEERGPVLRGEISVEQARTKEPERVRGVGERYRRVAEYDAVLRSHCGSGSVRGEDD